jgi:hypothetical protein
VRSKRTVVVVCSLLALLTACGGSPKKVAAQSKKSSKAARAHTTAPQAPPGVPRVMLQSGTSYQNGALVRFCHGTACRQGTGKAVHALEAPDPVLFIIDTIPQSATVTLTRAGATAPADTRALHVASLMLYAPTVGPGTYLVQLNANWPGSTGVWQFSIAIPST